MVLYTNEDKLNLILFRRESISNVYDQILSDHPKICCMQIAEIMVSLKNEI